jgi:hypothetical protein
LPLFEHVHQLNADDGLLSRLMGFEAEHGTDHPFYRTMILLPDIVEIAHLPNGDRGPMHRVVALDGCRVGLAPINRDLLGYSMAANRLRGNRSAAACTSGPTGGMSPRPLRSTAMEGAIKGRSLTERNIQEAAGAAVAAAIPMAMNAYKLDLTRGLLVRAFQQVA